MHYYVPIVNQLQRPVADIITEVRAHYYGSGLSQALYAEKAKVSQSTICRLLHPKSERARLSPGLRELCNYAGVEIFYAKKKDIKTQTELLSVLESIWNGTDAHARSLACLLKALGRV